MAIAIYFHPKGMTLAQFEDIHRRLAEAGDSERGGCLHHSCFGRDGDLMVYDIWESQEDFEAFGAKLMLIIAAAGVDVGEPAIMPVHRLEQVAH